MKHLKLFALLSLLLAGVSCGSDSNEDGTTPTPPPGPTPTGELRVVTSSTTIQANGSDYCTVTVFCGDTDVTADAEFYDMNSNPIDHLFVNGRYSADKPGSITFWVAYGTQNTFKAPTTITAVEAVLPDRLADPQPESTSFVRRVLITQFTSTTCGYCPHMIALLRQLAEESDYTSKYVLTSAHYDMSGPDPMRLSERLDQALGISGYPMLCIDMRQRFEDYRMLAGLKKVIDLNYGRTEAKAGISVHSVISGNSVIARVTVKAAEDNSFRIGAMVLEDGISAPQSNADNVAGDFTIHNNAIRLLDSKVSSTNYTGHSLGNLNKGDVTDYLFTFNLGEDWVRENCRLVFFVTAVENNNYYVNNVVETDGLAAELPFEYAK